MKNIFNLCKPKTLVSNKWKKMKRKNKKSIQPSLQLQMWDNAKDVNKH